jgi:predicted ATPase
MKFVEPVAEDTDMLLQAVFFARWCNRDLTLEQLDPTLLSDPVALQHALEMLPHPPWCNETAYPVERITWEGRQYSRVEAATSLFGKIVPFLREAVEGAGGDVVQATATIANAYGARALLTRNVPFRMLCHSYRSYIPCWLEARHACGPKACLAGLSLLGPVLVLTIVSDHNPHHTGRFGMQNDFPVFMAVMDLAWYRSDLISPGSIVPTGIGAVAYLDRLQQHLQLHSHAATCQKMIELQAVHWPEAKRSFQPIDIEYLSCECRKYYSYKNGTKEFEGKNVFIPGQSPMLPFDISQAATPVHTPTQIHVIAGGPCSGKTTLIAALQEAGYAVERETAERVINEGIAAGVTVEEQRMDPVAWQQHLLHEDFNLFNRLVDAPTPVLTDTSFLETVVFSARAGIAMGPAIDSWIRNRPYKTVFFLAPLAAYEETAVRMETHQVAVQISTEVQAAYAHYGYTAVVVPDIGVEARCEFVASIIEQSVQPHE